MTRSPMSLANEDESPSPFCEIPPEAQVRHESMLINEVSLILAEKRTALSVLRTGLAVLVLPLSVVSILVAVSRYYDPQKVFYLLAPLLGLSFILAIFGSYLVFRAWGRAMALDKLSLALKRQNPYLLELTESLGEPKKLKNRFQPRELGGPNQEIASPENPGPQSLKEPDEAKS
jgi:hypothetical protein